MKRFTNLFQMKINSCSESVPFKLCSSVLGFLMNIHAFLYENLVIKSMRSGFASAAVSFLHTECSTQPHYSVYTLKHPRDWDNRLYAHPATDIALATYSVTVWGQYPTANWRFCLDIRPIPVEHRGGVHLPSSTFACKSNVRRASYIFIRPTLRVIRGIISHLPGQMGLQSLHFKFPWHQYQNSYIPVSPLQSGAPIDWPCQIPLRSVEKRQRR